MTPAELSAAISAAVLACLQAGDFAGDPPTEVVVERPRNRAHGDYATNIALRLAKGAGRAPREVAEAVAVRLREVSGLAGVEVAGPGFLNITFAADSLGAVARAVVEADSAYGHNDTAQDLVVNLEYVSANPTGPVHLAHARWAAIGDALARLFTASGAAVTREYYVNDAGAQVDKLAASLDAVARAQPVPEGGYQGEYVDQVAAEIVAAHPGLLDEASEKALDVFKNEGIDRMLERIKQSLSRFGVDFDVFFSERSLYSTGAVDAAVQRLQTAGHVYEADGALWLRTTDFGDDKDRVIQRSDGRPTYFASDLAYYVDKRRRGADLVIIILGADHHGYVGRMRSMVAGLGEDPDTTLEIPIGQMVNVRGSRMSKRAGNVVTLDDLIEAIGSDAARYALVRSSIDSSLDLDLDLWASRTSDNPVFYVQYAHARLSSLQRSAADLGITRSAEPDLALLTHEREVELLGALGEFPRVVGTAAELRAAHRVARYLEELAGTYHRFYDSCRVLPQGDEPATPLTDARLWLCEATRTVLANGLSLLGVSAPERM